MACPECDATRAEFLRLRRAVLEFACTLNQFEVDRLERVDKIRPPGAPSMLELRALIERNAGLILNE